MTSISANGIELEYESFGPESAPAVLLIPGLGQQMIMWPDSMCDALVDEGFRVIRFDNRDSGLSTHLDSVGIPNIRAIMLRRAFGLSSRTPYSLLDMAADAASLLEGLGVTAAHVVGASMGGMIAQLLAAHHPKRVLSLTSIMSTSGNRRLGRPSSRAAKALLTPHAPPGNIEQIVARSLGIRRAFAGSAYPLDENYLRERIEMATRRSYNPAGSTRQLAASLASGDIRPFLRKLNIPVTVLHGEDDPLLPLACGIDTKENIPGAELVVIPGMGHEFPEAAMLLFAQTIASTARRV